MAILPIAKHSHRHRLAFKLLSGQHAKTLRRGGAGLLDYQRVTHNQIFLKVFFRKKIN